MIEILLKADDWIVIYKPPGIPSESDKSGDPDALTLTSEKLKDQGESDRLWLIHRLDRVVGGVMIFARNKKYSAILSELVRDRLITKQYYAVVDGETDDAVLEDLIFRDQRTSKAYITDRERFGVKSARLSYRRLAIAQSDKGMKSLLFVTLDTGRFHQIRAQLSHRKLPITGDGKYGSRDNKAKHIALMASNLEIDIKGRKIRAERKPDMTEYPWSLFSADDFSV